MRRAGLSIFLILFLLAVGAACALQGTTPVKSASVTGEPPEAAKEAPSGPAYGAPQLALGEEGQVYLLWHAMERGKGVHGLLAHSVDLGATWSEPPISIKPVQDTTAGGLRIATGPNGNIYIAWREWDPKTTTFRLQFVRSRDRGAHWVEAPRVVSGSDNMGSPTLLADHDGGVFIASIAGTNPKSNRGLDIISSHDFGATFPSTPSRLTTAFPTTEYGILHHRFVSDGTDRLYAIWEEAKTPADYRIYLSRSLDRGKTWGAQPILVSTPEESQRLAYSPRISAGPKGQVYVVWEQDDEFPPPDPEQPGASFRRANRFIYANRALDEGRTWLPQPIRLNPSEAEQRPVYSMMPQVSADQYGNVYTVWIEQREDAERLLFTRSIDSGMTWSTPRALNGLSKNALAQPEIRSDDKGHVWVIWQEIGRDPKEWRLMMNRSEDHGASWHEQATALTRSGQRVGKFRSVSFVNDRLGRLFVAWDGGPWNDRALYFNRSIDFGATWLSREIQVGRR